MVNCPDCGAENNDDAKFCKKCGTSLKSPVVTHKTTKSKDNNKTLIIAGIAIAIIVLAGIGIYASGILNAVPLETENFDYFTMDVPKDSDFKIANQAVPDDNHVLVLYKNEGKHKDAVEQFAFGKGLKNVIDGYTADATDGDLKIYKNRTGSEGYGVFVTNNGCDMFIIGKDLNTLKNMAKSFKDADLSDLTKNATATTTQSTASTSSSLPSISQSSSSMTINGGSFSTGSHLSDKTYAKIYVGPEHSGEKVKIQILYSRDGSSLNNGNMVPKTVTSNGYIEVASADSYKYYPDFAEIKLYDNSGNLMDTQSVSLSPESGTQNF